MRNKVEDITEDGSVVEDECHHYWLIDSAEGPTSNGVCKFCGAEKEFSNSFQDFVVLKRPARVLELAGTKDSEPEEAKDSPDVK